MINDALFFFLCGHEDQVNYFGPLVLFMLHGENISIVTFC